MRYRNRPSYKEIEKKISQAKNAIQKNHAFFGSNLDKLIDEFSALKINHTEEIWPLLLTLFDEIKPEHYAGPHPPMISHEPSVLNCEVFIFVWKSQKLTKKMYLKCVVKEDCFYYLSLHASNKPEKCWRLVQSFTPRR